MAERPDDGTLLDRYSRAQDRLEHARWLGLAQPRAGPAARARVRRRAARPQARRPSPGGELTRASLARALAGDPDLLLLDEPTNHLDIASLEWLEEYLTGLDAAVILVAHDRWFLEAVGTSVLELEAGRARFFPGTWHAWRREAAARDIAARQADREAAGRDRPDGALHRAVPLQGDQGAPGAVAREEAPEDGPDRARPRATTARSGSTSAAPSAPGGWCSTSPDGRLEVPGRTLLDDGELWLERGEHVSLVGPNGAGKTTLIEALAGRRELDGGKLRTGHNVQIGYLSQHAEELGSSGHACWRRRSAPPGSRRTRRAPCSAASCSAATRRRSRSTGCRAASAGGCRWRSWWRRGRTC